jgi:adhesin transport system membrane fusion protein
MVTKLAGRDAYSYNPNIRCGQKSRVEITADNSVTFGWMMSEVVSVSPDAIYDEALKESFYSVQVRTTGSPLKDSKGKRQLFIDPRTEADHLLTAQLRPSIFLT